MLKFAKALSTLQGDEYQGCFIGKLKYRRYASESNDGEAMRVFVTKKTKRYQVVLVRSADKDDAVSAELEVILMVNRLTGNADRQSVSLMNGGVLWNCFSAEEVYAFSELVHDTNAIHLTDRPVVQGMLIFMKLFEYLEAVQSLTMRFQSPASAGSEIYLTGQNGQLSGLSEGRIVFMAEYELCSNKTNN